MIVGNPGIRNPCAGRSTCRHSLVCVKFHLRQQRLQLGQPLRPRRIGLSSAQNHAQVVLQAPLDGIIQRQIQGQPGRLARSDTSLKAARGWSCALPWYLSGKLLRNDRQRRPSPHQEGQ